MTRFYGFDNLYGIDSRDANTGERVGCVVVFSSREARDEWVSSDAPRDGRYRREIITATEARREMVRVAYDDLLKRHIVWERADLKYVSIDTIISAYTRAIL